MKALHVTARRYSSSKDSVTHGRKLYWLWVKEVPAESASGDYVVAGKTNSVGHVVVKESWVAEEVTDENKKAIND